MAKDKVHVHDLHATILHLTGLNHEQRTFRHGGRDFRLTDVEGRVISDSLAELIPAAMILFRLHLLQAPAFSELTRPH